MIDLRHGDLVDVLPELEADSVDAVVCDPPYELGFMGKSWDSTGIAFQPDTWRHVLRVLKPGGHLLAFSGTRTYHRMVVAIEDAGFEIRDQLAWLYGTGFPKSLDVAKAIAKTQKTPMTAHPHPTNSCPGGEWCKCDERSERAQSGATKHPALYTYPDDSAAARWDGWGTALKPAQEPIVLARKPLGGTVAANVLEHGTGGINVDGCRVPHASEIDLAESQAKNPGRTDVVTSGIYGADRPQQRVNTSGRWPANVVLDEEAAALLDIQSGQQKDGVAVKRNIPIGNKTGNLFQLGNTGEDATYGGASRFFYCAKASGRERNEGLEHLPKKFLATMGDGIDGREHNPDQPGAWKQNHHPTVKPVELMRWLCRLVTPPGGVVLDPFLGSGSTGVAATMEGFRFIGVEREKDYLDIAQARILHSAAR